MKVSPLQWPPKMKTPEPPLFQLGSFRRNIGTTFGTEKLEWCGYTGEKNLKISLLVSTEYSNVTDGQTDGRTDRHHTTA